ncbi:MAG: WYL domain-containing protein [Nitrospirota bacterium]
MAFDEESLEIWRRLPRQPVRWNELMQDSVGQRLVYALQNNHRLEIIYSGRETPLSRRMIRPIETVGISGFVYIRAYCFLRQDERTFRLDRILAARVIGGPADYASEMSPRALPPTAYQDPLEVDGLRQIPHEELSPIRGGEIRSLEPRYPKRSNRAWIWWLVVIGLIIFWFVLKR